MGNIWPWPEDKVPWTPLTNASTQQCDAIHHQQHVGQAILLSTAGGVVVFLHVVKWLKSRSLFRLVVPVDLLTSSPCRLIYCLIMSLWAANVVRDLLNKDLVYYDYSNGVLNAAKVLALSPTVIFLRQALIYYPVLASVDFSVPCLGHYTGFLYTLLMASYNVFQEAVLLSGCTYRGSLPTKDVVVSLAIEVPVYIGFLLVALWFFCRAAMETVLLCLEMCGERDKERCCAHEVFSNRVRMLLHRYDGQKQSQRYGQVASKNLTLSAKFGLQYVLPYQSGFKYPLAFLAAVSMAWIITYQLCIRLMTVQYDMTEEFMHFVDSFNITVAELSAIFPEKAALFENVFYDFKSLTQSIQIILLLGSSCAFLGNAFLTTYMVQNFHKHLVRAAKGDISFLTASEPLPSKSYIVAAGMKFSAFQMTYLVFSWLANNLIGVAILSIGLVFYYLFKDFNFLGIYIWSWFMVPMVWAAVLHHLQLWLSRYVLLDNRAPGDLLHLRFKSLYLLLSYVLFFFNSIFAAIMSVLRILASFVFTATMYMRIDWDVYMRGLEGWDFGHRTYVGYMYLEYTYNNAVLRTFVQLLVDSVSERKLRAECDSPDRPVYAIQNLSNNASSPSIDTESENAGLLSEESVTALKACAQLRGAHHVPGYTGNSVHLNSRRARNLWLVAYTLIHNPQLVSLTASQLSVTRDY